MKPTLLILLSSLAHLFAGCSNSSPPDEITVKRINIVDESGVVRFVIAGDAPGPMVRGERLERSIAPAAIVLHDEDGNESGGIAVADLPDGMNARMMIFDFTHQITDGVRLGTFESDDGEEWRGGLTVYDRRPYDPGPVESSQGKKRIFLGNDQGDAGLVVLDSEERERIRIAVDADGVAIIEILDEDGDVVYRAPE